MKYTAAAVVAGLVTMVNATAQFTNSAFDIVAGQQFNLTWSDSDGTGPFTIELKTGPSTNLQTVATLTTTSDFYYLYTPSSSLASGTYAFQITDSTNVPNYSTQWSFQGLAASSSSSLSSTSASTTVTTTSSASASSSTSTLSTSTITTSSNSTTTAASAKSTGSATKTSSSAASATSSKAASTSIVNTNSGVQQMAGTPLLALGMAALFII